MTRSVAGLGLAVTVAFLVYVLTEELLWTLLAAFLVVCLLGLALGRERDMADRIEPK